MPGPIPILRLGDNLLAGIQGELRDNVADAFQQDVLERIEATGARGLLIDISALDFVDTYIAKVLVDTARMARLMGTETVLTGMRPEVAATLVHMGYSFEGVRTSLDAESGLELLKRLANGA